MKTIYRIAKTELNTMFYSPVAWVVLVIFSIQSSWKFFNTIERFEKAQKIGQSMDNLSQVVFSGFSGLYTEMQSYLYLYVPLLTMGLVSREINSGSIKLLLSSPIRIKDIVLGKYLAIAAYCLLFIAILGLQVAIAYFSIDNLDLKFAISGLIGLYLLVCTYAAIGLFMSCLTSYQVVAAISTLVVLAGLNFIGKLWQDVEIVKDITYFLSIAGRADEMLEGLIISKDVFYFVLVSSLFIVLSIYKLQTGRDAQTVSKRVLKYTLLITIVLSLGYITSRAPLTLYHDMTRTKDKTLTKTSLNIVEKIDGPIKLTTYVNLLDINYFMVLPASQNSDIASFEKYTRFLPQMEMEYVYYYDKSNNEALYAQNPGLNDKQLAEKLIETQNMKLKKLYSPAEMKKIVDLGPEQNRVVRTVEYKGKKTFLRFFDDLFKVPLEKEISASLKRLVVSPPKIVFATGNMERSVDKNGDKNYKTGFNEVSFRYSFINQGFDVSSVDINAQDIPAETTILIIADPKTQLSQGAVDRITKYIDQGKNLMLLAEPETNSALAAITDKLGVSFTKQTLVQESETNSPDFLVTELQKNVDSTIIKFSKINNPIPLLGSSGITATKDAGFKITPLLKTNNQPAWESQAGITSIPEELKKQPSSKEIPLVTALTRNINGKTQKIIIAGDADFMGNAELSRGGSGTFQFVTDIFSWFSNSEFPIDTTRPEHTDNKITINANQVFINKIVFIGLFPLLIILSGAFILIRRNRR
ncbi:ABC-2 type transport system permease protein [Flavobacterium nitrogenifigens]|uniref:ABC-2 type transport system permease protein n=2 Tax=Flavobacterium TaxID=237 RepID=A0A7W7N6F8_9FLAO|nr:MULTISPECIES: Gldg family protein [Flavobacterium]MBB4801633.1 ABC-2 type transport system permease protein [Flavobacterium nitrogenifigens]MBB6386591.1 ABC-2 type transport system permease protein [Flavobacterium notoginsengisoli]